MTLPLERLATEKTFLPRFGLKGRRTSAQGEQDGAGGVLGETLGIDAPKHSAA